jgi:hypothetical protein
MNLFEKLVGIVVGMVIFALIVWAGGMAAFSVWVEGQCLAHRFPNSRVDWKGNAYCLIRYEQTDILRPLQTVLDQDSAPAPPQLP